MSNGNGEDRPRSDGWMNDVQKSLAYIITFSFIALIFVWVFAPPSMAPESMAQLNALVSTLQNIMLVAIGFFFGSNLSAKTQSETQSKIVEKLTGTPSPPGPPGPVAPAPALVVPWWSMLTDDEKKAVTEASGTNPRVRMFAADATVGRARPEDLDYVVSQGIISADRAAAIRAA